MTAQQMEKRLLELQERFKESRDPAVREEYKKLYAQWVEAKRG